MDLNEGADKVAQGIISHYGPDLTRVEKQLSELTIKQASVLKELQKENVKCSSLDTNELIKMFQMMKEYHSRLATMKKDMMAVAEKSEKLKVKNAKDYEPESTELSSPSRTKDGKAKNSAPKFDKELSFQNLYPNENDKPELETTSVLSPQIAKGGKVKEDLHNIDFLLCDNKEEQSIDEAVPDPLNLEADSPTMLHTQNSLSTPVNSIYEKNKFVVCTSQETSLVSDQQKSKGKNQEITTVPSIDHPDILTEFFINMAKTVKGFPVLHQIEIKAKLFKIVNSVELKLANEMFH